MYSFSTWAAVLQLATLCFAKSGTVSFKTYVDRRRQLEHINKRTLGKRTSTPFPVALGNDLASHGLYYVNATVGTPGQTIQLQLDTGSSDIWMFGANSCERNTSDCLGGEFDISKSSTAVVIGEGQFQIQYATPGSGVIGDYFTDDYSVGDITVRNLTMALATRAEFIPTGIMGIAFDTDESITTTGGRIYNNFIDELVDQRLIETRSYSLYLDDKDAATGTILFGGYDEDKFEGDLSILQLQPNGTQYSYFGVILESIGVVDSNNSIVISTPSLPAVAVLDSGTTLTTLPADIINQLVDYFGAINADGTYIVDCNLGGLEGALEYKLGGPDGPVIGVKYSELVYPYTGAGTSNVDDDGVEWCILGVEEQYEGVPLLLGDTFLRSAYVVYDIDSLQIGIAQTKFNVSSSNIKAITAGSGQNLPGSVVSGAETKSATGSVGAGAGTLTSTAFATATAGAASTFGIAGNAAALTGTSTTYSNSASLLPTSSVSTSSSGGLSVSTAAAASYKVPPSGYWVNIAMPLLAAFATFTIGVVLVL